MVLFIAVGGRNYRRIMYARNGIPRAKGRRISAIREIQFNRLIGKFEYGETGLKLIDKINSCDKLFIKLSKPGSKSSKLAIAKAELALVRARAEYASALLDLVRQEKGVYEVVLQESYQLYDTLRREFKQKRASLKAFGG